MMIGRAARAAGTTPRAIRHYHRLGLLPEPARRANGYRDYSLADLARLLRIRWLADNGVPLGSISAMLSGRHAPDDPDPAVPAGTRDHDATDVRADLTALVANSEREIVIWTRRRDRLRSMLAAAETGRALSALPESLVDAFARVDAEATDPAERAVLARERELLEVLALCGEAPTELLDWFTAMLALPGHRSDYLAVMRSWAALEGLPLDRAEPLIDDLVTDIVRRVGPEFGRSRDCPEIPESPGALEPPDIPHTFDDFPGIGVGLDEIVPDLAQRTAITRIAEALAGHGGAASGARS